MNAVLQQAEQRITRERQRLPPANPWRLLPDLLRNSLASLALTIGFAALAVRPGAELPLLQECQLGVERLRLRPASPQGRISEAEYLHQISQDDEQQPR